LEHGYLVNKIMLYIPTVIFLTEEYLYTRICNIQPCLI
jgi:hypothetical protein